MYSIIDILDASSAEDDESRSEGLSPIWGIQELDEKNFEQGTSFVTTCINWLVLTEGIPFPC